MKQPTFKVVNQYYAGATLQHRLQPTITIYTYKLTNRAKQKPQPNFWMGNKCLYHVDPHITGLILLWI